MAKNRLKSGLEDIGKYYFEQDNVYEGKSLENIEPFREFFQQYLQRAWKVTDTHLEESFQRWCRNLSKGTSFHDARKVAVYSLWIQCELKQYHIARLLNVSTRTIRRDMRELEKKMSMWN